jgi:hypothetical protein
MGLLIALWIIEGAVGTAIGVKKGKPWMGLALGVLLGVIGVIIMLFVKPDRDYLVKQERERQEISVQARGCAGTDSPTEMFKAYQDH